MNSSEIYVYVICSIIAVLQGFLSYLQKKWNDRIKKEMSDMKTMVQLDADPEKRQSVFRAGEQMK